MSCEPTKMKSLRCEPNPQLIPPCPDKLLLNLALDCFQQTIVTQGFQKWYNPNHNKNLHEVLSQITEYSKTRHMRFPIVQNWTTVRSTAGSCMRRLWDVVQLLNPTNSSFFSAFLITQKIIPSKLEVAPNALKMLDGVGEWMDGYPLDCYDY